MKYVLAGASGFLGKALARDLVANGHQVVRLVRRPPSTPDEVRWDPARGDLDPGALDDPDVLVNLAGANIGRPWTPTYRLKIRESRVSTTATLAAVATQLDRRPALLTQSGIGGYGTDLGDRILTEDSDLGEGFLADVVRLWEGALEPAREAGSRVAALRTGVVLDSKAPAFQLLSLPFRLGLGGRLGPGTQYFPVVSLTDWIRAVRHVAENDSVSGPVNITLPTPATNLELAEALATALHRPSLVPVPAILMKAALGEFAWELLGSKRALPTRLQSTGFTFHHPTVTTAISAALA
ncbi:TIGR01777 family oxidoreductase [Kribbella sindirgiensis]|uniref:TIGR01777 family protein n=1 Tax=Kribbella sindirgiensis TaxID=1124744 RepID=A0A4R0IL83_9ACTN|nr:TIGR01777 family oxidoreductase [Kribbella sindirgiensis]TCC33579.1 TIGR01777 family protein [Kribbella sindirgiensis]